MNNTLKILKAGNGDSLLIRFEGNDSKYKNILIDGGNKRNEYDVFLKKEILEIKEKDEFIDLLIITHTDQDHVKGIQYLLNDTEIDNSLIKLIWFNQFDKSFPHNTNDISYNESCKIQNLIINYNILRVNNIALEEFEEHDFYGAKITLLSPSNEDLNKLIEKNSSDISSSGNDYNFSIEELITKNSNIFKDKIEELDTTIENRVSIAILIEIYEKSLLLLGDANPDLIKDSIAKIAKQRKEERLKVDYVKLSHHASHRSLSLQLIDLIDSNHFIVSANGRKASLPNKLTFAKILNREAKNDEKDYFIFNYDEVIDDLKFSADDLSNYNFNCLKSNFSNGYIIDL